MGRLFDKYLISLTNQRIPMPKNWQTSLGLELTEAGQKTVVDNTTIENTGYKFQQDDTISRGYVYSSITSKHLTDSKLYQLQLYIKALQEHQKKAYLPYFNPTIVSIHNFTCTSVAPVLAGDKYTLLGKTTLPVKWEYYSEATDTVFASGTIDSLSVPYLIDTSKYSELVDGRDDQEYYLIRVTAASPVVIVNGIVNRFNSSSANPFTARTVISADGRNRSLKIPAIINGGRYSDKLIPALLDMQLTSESSNALREDILSQLSDSRELTVEDAIRFNTVGIYDVDEYIGRNLRW